MAKSPAKKREKANPTPTLEEIELNPDTWADFEGQVRRAAKMRNKTKKNAPSKSN